MPLGETAAEWIERYLTDARPIRATLRPYESTLFLVRTGRPLLQFQIRGIRRF